MQEYYRLVRISQTQKVQAEKKKKQKMAKLNEYFRENLALVEQIIMQVLSYDVVVKTKDYLQGLFTELQTV